MADNCKEPGDGAERSHTPPLLGTKRVHSAVITGKQRAASEGVNPQAVNNALEGLVEGVTRSRGETPVASPSRKRQRIVGDR